MALGADEPLAGAFSCGSFLCLPRRSWLREVVGEGLTFSWLSPARGVAEAPASPVSHMGPLEVLPQTCCPLCGVPHICLTVSWGVSRCSWKQVLFPWGSQLCAGRGAQPGLGGTALVNNSPMGGR